MGCNCVRTNYPTKPHFYILLILAHNGLHSASLATADHVLGELVRAQKLVLPIPPKYIWGNGYVLRFLVSPVAPSPLTYFQAPVLLHLVGQEGFNDYFSLATA